MKKTPLLAGTLAAALMLTGCQESKVEEKVEAETKTEVKKEDTTKEAPVEKTETSEETKAPSMSKEEVTKLIGSTLEKIESSLDEAWEENNWNSSEEADLNVFKEKLKGVTSEEFVDTEIKNWMNMRYYEGTDIHYKPYTLLTDIRLDVIQEEQRLEATTFEPENLLNSGVKYKFTFDYIDDKWILKGWTGEAITNLGLTKEESQQLLEKHHGYSNITFKEEKETDKGTVFVFSLGNDATLTFNPNTTEYTEAYPEVKKEEVKEEKEEVSYEKINYKELDAKADELVMGYKTQDGKTPGTNPFYELGVTYYIYEYFKNLGSYDFEHEDWLKRYPYEKAQYILSDSALNGVWNIISEKLEASELETLKAEQKEWVKQKEASAQKALNSEDDELIGKVKYYTDLEIETTARCDELIEKYYYLLEEYN